MRIAVSSDGSNGLEAGVSQHFGRCPYYTLVDVDDDVVAAVQVVANPHYPDHVPGVVPRFIHGHGADVMLTGGMGHRAVTLFTELGITPVTGAAGSVRQALEAYARGQLSGAAPCRESSQGCGPDHEHGRG